MNFKILLLYALFLYPANIFPEHRPRAAQAGELSGALKKGLAAAGYIGSLFEQIFHPAFSVSYLHEGFQYPQRVF